MTGPGMGPSLPMSVTMMAAMMLPGAVPAIARHARERGGVVTAPVFAGSYLVIWALAAVTMCLLYRPPGDLPAGALIVAAGLYELTPVKRTFRHRCREHVGSGLRFGAYCFGSSVGLMLVLVAVDVMSLALMIAIAVVVLVQKLAAPHPALDTALALAIVGLGLAISAT